MGNIELGVAPCFQATVAVKRAAPPFSRQITEIECRFPFLSSCRREHARAVVKK
jgi:hypothetical protein